MKYSNFRIALLVTTWLVVCTGIARAQQKGYALVELYTSEGCSSCPAAEKLVPALQQEYGDRLYVLEFHVDYWNGLGWEDKYSKKEYADRQRKYSIALGGNTVYTPQAIVNGKAHVTGSDKEKLSELIAEELGTRTEGRKLTLNAHKKGNKVEVTYTADPHEEEATYIALVQKTATTDVKDGENAGRQLVHHDIVRQLVADGQKEGKVSLTLPDGVKADACYVMAYIQNIENMKIGDVLRADIQ